MNTELLQSYAEDFLKYTRCELENIARSFFKIGFRLHEANEEGYYKQLGYTSIEELAEQEFDIRRSTTYELMAIWVRFHDEHNKMCIKEEYKGYSFSQLVELKRCNNLPSNVQAILPVKSSVRDIRAYVKDKENQRAWRLVEPLEEWKARTQAVEEVSEPKEEPPEEKTQCDVSEETDVEGTEIEAETVEVVQTSGQNTVLEHNFTFDTRADIRAFLTQTGRWNSRRTEDSPKLDEREEMISEHIFRNGDKIVQYKNRTLPTSITGVWDFALHYFFKQYNHFGLYEVTKDVLEKYMMEHRDEL